MKFATIPLWTKDRDTVDVDCTHTMAFPMTGISDDNGGAAPLTLCPISMTLEKAVEYWWRVRKWKMSFTVTGLGSFELYPERQMDDERELIGTPQAPALGINAYDYGWHHREIYNLDENGDFIPGEVRYINAYVGMCPPTGWNAVVTDSGGTGGGSPSAGNPDFTVLYSYGLPPSDGVRPAPELPNNDHPSVRLIYPTFFVAIYGYWEQGTEADISASTVAWPMPPGSTDEPYSIPNLNNDIPITMASDNINHWGVASFRLEPFEWWPWGGTWDANTGARL